MKKSFKDRIIGLGLSYQKEISTIVVINLVLLASIVVAYLYLKQMIVLIIGVLVIAIFNFFYLTRYSSIEKRIEKKHVDELISLLSYFEIFISNKNNVYVSLRMLIPYSSQFMQDALNSLLLQIDSDKTVQPFITFANKFSNRIIESLMLSIYQMIDNGESTRQFDEFDSLFSTISKDFHNSLIEDKKKSLDTMTSFPLFGAGAIVIILTVCILSVVGDMISVL